MMESFPHSSLRLMTLVFPTWVSSCPVYTPIKSLICG